MIETIRKGVSFKGELSFLAMLICFSNIFYCISSIIQSDLQNFIYSILIFVVGIPTMLSIRGAEVDFEKRKIRIFRLIFFKFRIGEWQELSSDSIIELVKIKIQTKLYSRLGASPRLYYRYNVSVKFDNKDSILLNDFTEYKSAREYLDYFSEKTQLSKVDRFEEVQERISKTKKERGYR
jgi:hypothetical protein